MQSCPPDQRRQTKTNLHRQKHRRNSTNRDRNTDKPAPHCYSAPPPCPPPLLRPQSILIDQKKFVNFFWRFMEFREPNYYTKRSDLFLAAAGLRLLCDRLPALARTILHRAPKGPTNQNRYIRLLPHSPIISTFIS
jgi:hypothetical protein